MYFDRRAQLRKQRISPTATIRSDRKYFTTELKKWEKFKREDYRYLTSNGVSRRKSMDKKRVSSCVKLF